MSCGFYLHEQALMVIFCPWSEQRYGMKNEAVAKSSLCRRRLGGTLTSVYEYWRGVCEEDSVRLFPVASSDKRRSNGHKWKHRRFHLNVRKHLPTMRLTKRWHRLPRVVMESPFVEIVKNQLDTVLDNQF